MIFTRPSWVLGSVHFRTTTSMQHPVSLQIMSAYVTMLNTAQTKLNSMGLESLPDLIMNLHSSFKDVTPQLVPALLKLISSKQHSDMAQKNIELLVKYVGKCGMLIIKNVWCKQASVSRRYRLVSNPVHACNRS